MKYILLLAMFLLLLPVHVKADCPWLDPCPRIPGDMNGDNLVNGDDIHWFVLAMVTNFCDFRPEHEVCCAIDLNQDCHVNGDDIEPFVDCLLYGCP